MILAIDSGSEFVSVCLGSLESCSTVTLSQGRNSESLLAAINYLLNFRKQESVSKVAVCIGPGSYTGLRVGLALAQGLSVGFSAPLVGVSSFLAALYLKGETEGIEHSNASEQEIALLLRQEEVAIGKFSVVNLGKQVAELENVRVESSVRVPDLINAKGVLRAALKLEKFTSLSGEFLNPEVQHFVELSGGDPIKLMYVKGVQAKTMSERGL